MSSDADQKKMAVAPGAKLNAAGWSSARPALTAYGPTIEFVMRSYAPFASFGAPAPMPGFEGDNRGSSTSPHVSARITSAARLATFDNTAEFKAFSDESSWPALPFKHDQYSYWPAIIPRLQISATAISLVRGEVKSEDGPMLRITMHHWGAMPLLPSPDIDLYGELLITIGTDGSMHIAAALYGDGFPNAELFARLGDGRAFMLHSFDTTAGKLGPLYMLWGNSKRAMGSSTTIIPATRALPQNYW